MNINFNMSDIYSSMSQAASALVKQTSDAVANMKMPEFGGDVGVCAVTAGVAGTVLSGGNVIAGGVAALGAATILNSVDEKVLESMKTAAINSLMIGTLLSGGNIFVGLAAAVAAMAATLFAHLITPQLEKLFSGEEGAWYETSVRKMVALVAAATVMSAVTGFSPHTALSCLLNLGVDAVRSYTGSEPTATVLAV